MTQKSDLGKYGEDFACEYLVKKSYKIIERNYRKPWGEIDVIARDPKGILVFVEVKTMRQYGNSEKTTVAGLSPEDQMTLAKMKKFKRTAQEYMQRNASLVKENGWRCDLISLTISNNNYIIRHYENI